MPEVVRIVVAMTARALKYRVVAGVGVAIRAGSVGPAIGVIHWEVRVVERRIQPIRRAMASGARCWKSCRDVVWIVGLLVIELVT